MVSNIIERPKPIEWLKRWSGRPLIKVVTGIRRCGKSTVLRMFADSLVRDGVDPDAVFFCDLEKMGFDAPTSPKELHDLVVASLPQEGRRYVFIDEVQKVHGFESAIDALYARDEYDIYITGSNSDLLSSELATLLTGRHIEYRLLPLSFAELRSGMDPAITDDALLARYLTYGGMPYVAQIPEFDVAEYLEGVLSTILVKDVARRHPRLNLDSVQRVLRFVADNVGNPYSLSKIADGLAERGPRMSVTSVGEYLDALSQSYVTFQVNPYDVKGRQLLHRGGKCYLCDLGFRHFLLGHDQSDIGRRLENAVYLELLRRYPKVFIGKTGALEIDFVCEGSGGIHYYQVATSVLDERTRERELASLRMVADNYPKALLTLDRIGLGDYAGVRNLNVIDWLLGRC